MERFLSLSLSLSLSPSCSRWIYREIEPVRGNYATGIALADEWTRGGRRCLCRVHRDWKHSNPATLSGFQCWRLFRFRNFEFRIRVQVCIVIATNAPILEFYCARFRGKAFALVKVNISCRKWADFFLFLFFFLRYILFDNVFF